jgi:hypothetical protein
MPDKQDSNPKNSRPKADKPQRPRLLIEVLVGEYEQQCRTNSRLNSLEDPFTDTDIKHKCNDIIRRANSLLRPGDDESAEERCRFIEKENDELVKRFYRQLHKKSVSRAALCFSGGGIRSATFALGLMQGLVRRGVKLEQFHYLSTVSGGGYIGSWLSAWIHRHGVDSVEEGLKCLAEDKLPPSDRLQTAPNRDSAEPEPIRHLRRFSNYMSPRVGLLSADTWTLASIYLRNLLLNWTMLIPLLMAALAVPRLAMAIAAWDHPDGNWWPRIEDWSGRHFGLNGLQGNLWVERAAIMIGFLAGVVGIAFMIANTPSWRKYVRLKRAYQTEKAFLRFCWLMLLSAAFLSSAYWAWVHIFSKDGSRLSPRGLFWLAPHHWWWFVSFGLISMLTGFFLARWCLTEKLTEKPSNKTENHQGLLKALTARLIAGLKSDVALSLSAGAIVGFCLWKVTHYFDNPLYLSRAVLLGGGFQAGLFIVARISFIRRPLNEPVNPRGDLCSLLGHALVGALAGIGLWGILQLPQTSWKFVLFGTLFHTMGYLVARIALIEKRPYTRRCYFEDALDFTLRAATGALGGICLWGVTFLFQPPVPLPGAPSNQKTIDSPRQVPTPSPTPVLSTASGKLEIVLPNMQTSPMTSTTKLEVVMTPQPEDAKDLSPLEHRALHTGLYVTFAPSLFLLMFLLAAAVFTGVASTYTNDADREWMARGSAWMLIAILGWSGLCGLVIYGPVGLAWLWHKFFYSLISVGAGSGLLTLLGGFSAKTAANKEATGEKEKVGAISRLLASSLPLAAGVFTVIILIVLSLATSKLIVSRVPSSQDQSQISPPGFWWHLVVLYESPVLLVAEAILLLLLFGCLMSLVININKFSLHAAYRDRLVRAYLGASQGTKRRPNPFTGFDDLDNLQMHDLLTDIFRPDNFGPDLSKLVGELRKPHQKSQLAKETSKPRYIKAREFVSRGLNPVTVKLLDCQAAIEEEKRLEAELRQTLADEFDCLIEDEKLEKLEKLEKRLEAAGVTLRRALADEFNRLIEAEELWKRDEFQRLMTCEIRRIIKKQPVITLGRPFKPRRNHKRRRKVWRCLMRWLAIVFKPRRVYVEKLRINRLLVERAFDGFITSPDVPAARTDGKKPPEIREQCGVGPQVVPAAPTDGKVHNPRPMHIFNIALNLVGGKDLAWQERKAQPFTVSALHAGSHGLGYRPVSRYAISTQQDAALSLGTAMAISGAAVSPNMGYHSSSFVTFVMMLFNARLGWWLGNPGEAGWQTHLKASPFFTPKPLIAELLGLTDSNHAYVALSDGDHFENLALYEMVRRRCHFIIVSDVGADPTYSFHDLGNALRKIRIDLGISIEFTSGKMPICPHVPVAQLFAKNDDNGGKYCALAEIKYKEVDGEKVDGEEVENGWLLYIKPTAYGIEPPDVQNYAKAHTDFPHETTGDQMYSESQFESYRRLGEHVIEQITNNRDTPNTQSLLNEVRRYLGLKPAYSKKIFPC